MFDKILEKYNFKYKSIVELNKGYASKKWIVTDQNNNKYVLKEITKQKIERLDFILNVQSCLMDYAPTIIENKENRLFCCYEDYFYYLSEFIDGTTTIDSNNHYFEIGQFLSKLHLRLKSINGVEKQEFLKIENNEDKIKDLLDFYKLQKNSLYEEILNYKHKILKYINEQKINYNLLEYQIVHGDFYIDNILLCNNSFKIIDFDQSCYFYKEYEILRGMFMICLNIELPVNDIFKHMKEFISGYTDANCINSPIDAYNLYLYIQANSLSGLRMNEYKFNEKIQFAIKKYNILKFLFENKDVIVDMLGENSNEKTYSSFSNTIQIHK